MARIALTRTDETDFTPKGLEQPSEGTTVPVFRIAPLTGAQRHEVNVMRARAFRRPLNEQEAEFDMGGHVNAMRQAARYGLRGWSGVEDEDGKTVAWPGDADRAIALLPTPIVTAIGDAICDRSNLTAEQRGN